MTSNISQAYPYSSETEAERARPSRGRRQPLRDSTYDDRGRGLAPASPAPDPDERWWTYHHGGCGGTLHAAGYARDQHAVYVVCDRCGKTALR